MTPMPTATAAVSFVLAVVLSFLISGLIISRPPPAALVVAMFACILLVPFVTPRHPAKTAVLTRAFTMAVAGALLMAGAGVLIGYVVRVPFAAWDRHPALAGLAIVAGAWLFLLQRRQ